MNNIALDTQAQSRPTRTAAQAQAIRDASPHARGDIAGKNGVRGDVTWVRPHAMQTRPELTGPRLIDALEWMHLRRGAPMTDLERKTMSELAVRAWTIDDLRHRAGLYDPCWMSLLIPRRRKGWRQVMLALLGAFRSGAVGIMASYGEWADYVGCSISTWGNHLPEMEAAGLVQVIQTWRPEDTAEVGRPRKYGRLLYRLGPAVEALVGLAVYEGCSELPPNVPEAWIRRAGAIARRKYRDAQEELSEHSRWIQKQAQIKRWESQTDPIRDQPEEPLDADIIDIEPPEETQDETDSSGATLAEPQRPPPAADITVGRAVGHEMSVPDVQCSAAGAIAPSDGEPSAPGGGTWTPPLQPRDTLPPNWLTTFGAHSPPLTSGGEHVPPPGAEGSPDSAQARHPESEVLSASPPRSPIPAQASKTPERTSLRALPRVSRRAERTPKTPPSDSCRPLPTVADRCRPLPTVANPDEPRRKTKPDSPISSGPDGRDGEMASAKAFAAKLDVAAEIDALVGRLSPRSRAWSDSELAARREILRAQAAARRSDDVRDPVQLSIADLIEPEPGEQLGEKSRKRPRKGCCEACSGTGVSAIGPWPCSRCRGAGALEVCPDCTGGFTDLQAMTLCSRCGGRGTLRSER